jgi:ribonucleoside-diphosphate reductase alpha chain
MKIKSIEQVGFAYTYDIEVEEVNEYLLSNGVVSHNTSSQIADVTEGIEPVKDIFSLKQTDRGTFPQAVPDARALRAKYSIAHSFSNDWLIDLAGIRQKYIEQAQSINTYEEFDNKDKSYSVMEEIKLWLRCYKKGVKSLYYFNGLKGVEKEECDSCGS